MGWSIGALALVGAVVLGALALSRARAPTGPREPDPLFILGIPLAGAGAALIATTRPVSVALIALGLALVLVGAVRSEDRTE